VVPRYTLSGYLPDWEIISQALLDRFGPSSYDDPMKALTRLKQQSSVEEYKGNFEVLPNRLRSSSENYKLSCFLNGLKEEIRLPVRMFTPKTLLAAYGLVKIKEEHVLNGMRSYRSFNWNVPNSDVQKMGIPSAN